MNEKRLTELLKMAEAGVDAPGTPDVPEMAASDLARRAIGRALGRARLRRIGYSVLAVDAAAALVYVAFLILPVGAPEAVTHTPQNTVAEAAESDYERLQAQLAMQEAVVEALRNDKVLYAVVPAPDTDPLAEVRAQTDLAARRMVLTADRIERDNGPSDFTRGLYGNVVANFPDSAWATVARRRINEPDTFTEPRSAL